MELTAKDFAGFSRPSHAKVVWNFKLRSPSPAGSVLSTETRIKCFAEAALMKFRIYWSLVRPSSARMRKAILKKMKTEAGGGIKDCLSAHSGARFRIGIQQRKPHRRD